MSIANHALVGTAIALVIKQPLLALPLAFASHFVLDVLPHFGYQGAGIGEALTHKLTFVEIGWSNLAILILLFTIHHTWLTLWAAVLAVSPDFEWPVAYFGYERKGLKPPRSPIAKFHSKLQWGERPWGILVEVGFFVLVYLLLRRYLI